MPEIRDIQDKARVLTDKIKQSSSMQDYRPVALRMINALAVHRLTLTDIYAPVGLTPKQLRDQLCLYLPLPEQDADFLLATVESILKDISRVVSGQFLSHSNDNDQYYLDLKKDIDFDALIEQRADTLGPNELDRYYFEILARVLECTDTTYVPGFRIWEREIPWLGQGITRRGYIFLGAPNQRSTAHPERDFYLHFLSPYQSAQLPSQFRPDELFITCPQPEVDFTKSLKFFAGSRELGLISSGSNRDQYGRKAEQFLRSAATWLRDNLTKAFQVTLNGETKPVSSIVAEMRINLRESTFRDQVYRISSGMLAGHFATIYPNYPRFNGLELTTETIKPAIETTLRGFANQNFQRNSQIILEGLGLASQKGGRLVLAPESSPYTADLFQRLAQLPEGKVINRSELISGEPGAEVLLPYKIELEWFTLVLAALIQQGFITVNLAGRQIGTNEFETLPISELVGMARFSSISKPKAMQEVTWRELLQGLSMEPDLVSSPGLLIPQLQERISNETDRVLRHLETLRDSPRYWQKDILGEDERKEWREALTSFRDFLDSLRSINSPGKMLNLNRGTSEIRAALAPRAVVEKMDQVNDILTATRADVEYLVFAESNMPYGSDWVNKAASLRAEHISALQDPERRYNTHTLGLLRGGLANLRDDYTKAYQAFHNELRLDLDGDEAKTRLTRDPRWSALQALATLNFLPTKSLTDLQNVLANIQSCPSFQPNELRSHTACPHCGLIPRNESVTPARKKLADCSSRLDELTEQWTTALLNNLSLPETAENIGLLSVKEQESVYNFVNTGKLPERVTNDLLDGLRDALQGLQRVEIDGADLMLALTMKGMPCDSTQLTERFHSFIREKTEGKDVRRVRIYIDW